MKPVDLELIVPTRIHLGLPETGFSTLQQSARLFPVPSNECDSSPVELSHRGITEIAFWVDDIEKSYLELRDRGVEFYSPPQLFQFAGYKAKAVYFWGPDRTTLELIQNVRE